VAAAVLLGFPRPVKGVEFGAGGERLAGEVLGLGLLLDEQDNERGTAKAGVVVEMVHLGGAVVVPEGQSDGHAAFVKWRHETPTEPEAVSLGCSDVIMAEIRALEERKNRKLAQTSRH